MIMLKQMKPLCKFLMKLDEANTTKSYMWCYRGGRRNNLSIVYNYQETRGGYHAQQFLSGFKGFLQSDAYAGYNCADEKTANIISVGCHAHARTSFAELGKIAQGPRACTRGNQILSKIIYC